MYLKRKVDEILCDWKSDPDRKPLIIKGSRQVGKTESIKHFAEKNYESVIEINFVRDEKYKGIISDGYEAADIIKNISLIDPSKKFIPEKTLIFFDEITEFPEIATSLKFFCIDKRFDVICSGSMLGVNYRKIESNSVGYKKDYEMFSLDFEEFLWAKGYDDTTIENMLAHMRELCPFNDLEMKVYHSLFFDFSILGGMPAVVAEYIKKNTFENSLDTQKQLITDYKEDIRKYAQGIDQTRILNVFNRIAPQLARENKKFIYKVVKEGARAREYENALQWLVDARLVHKIYRSSAPGLPIAAYDDLSAFKIYLVDVGLLRRLAQLAPTAFGEGNRLFTEFKGALTENFILQTLITQFEVVPRYWSQSNPPYEVDFLIQRENDIFPVEVKSEANTTSKSLKKFKELFPDKVKLRIRFSLDNLKLDDDVLNIPLFMADQADRLIGLALQQRNR